MTSNRSATPLPVTQVPRTGPGVSSAALLQPNVPSTSVTELQALARRVATLEAASLKRPLTSSNDAQEPPTKRARVATVEDLDKDTSDVGKVTKLLYDALMACPVEIAFPTESKWGVGEVRANYAAWLKDPAFVTRVLDVVRAGPNLPVCYVFMIALALEKNWRHCATFYMGILYQAKPGPARFLVMPLWSYLRSVYTNSAPPHILLKLCYMLLTDAFPFLPIFMGVPPEKRDALSHEVLQHLVEGQVAPSIVSYRRTPVKFVFISGAFFDPVESKPLLLPFLETKFGPLHEAPVDLDGGEVAEGAAAASLADEHDVVVGGGGDEGDDPIVVDVSS